MGAFTSGNFPVYNEIFKIGTAGEGSTADQMKIVKDVESISIKIDGKVESWNSMDKAGWASTLMTAKSFTVTCKGKRNVGDPGNDYVAGIAWADGLDCSTIAEIDFPDGSRVNFNCVVDVTNPGADESTKAAPLEFDLKSNGKPTFTPGSAYAALALSTSTPAKDATAVSTSTGISLTFSNPIESQNVFLIDATDSSVVPSTVTLDGSRKVITITPTTMPLTTAKKYGIVIAGVKDVFGQTFAPAVNYFTCA